MMMARSHDSYVGNHGDNDLGVAADSASLADAGIGIDADAVAMVVILLLSLLVNLATTTTTLVQPCWSSSSTTI